MTQDLKVAANGEILPPKTMGEAEAKLASDSGPKKSSNILVLSQFFGVRPGQRLQHFVKEVKELSKTEIGQLADGIRDESFTY